jgi:hypothetical protein
VIAGQKPTSIAGRSTKQRNSQRSSNRGRR